MTVPFDICSGVDVVGPSHISTLFQSIPSYWAPMKKQLVHRVGDVENDQELNERISPFYHADKIKVPLLIGQGANDPRVKQAEADQIFNAMKVCTVPPAVNQIELSPFLQRTELVDDCRSKDIVLEVSPTAMIADSSVKIL